LSSPPQTLRYIDQQAQLYNEQGPDDASLPRAFLDAALRSLSPMATWQEDASSWRGRCLGGGRPLGSDSTEVVEYGALAQDPSKHELYGISMKWRTTVDEVPCGLEPGDFEDWLWKREKP
jgi:hypothetical protein